MPNHMHQVAVKKGKSTSGHTSCWWHKPHCRAAHNPAKLTFLPAVLMAVWMSSKEGTMTTRGTLSCTLTSKRGRSTYRKPALAREPSLFFMAVKLALVAERMACNGTSSTRSAGFEHDGVSSSSGSDQPGKAN